MLTELADVPERRSRRGSDAPPERSDALPAEAVPPRTPQPGADAEQAEAPTTPTTTSTTTTRLAVSDDSPATPPSKPPFAREHAVQPAPPMPPPPPPVSIPEERSVTEPTP